MVKNMKMLLALLLLITGPICAKHDQKTIAAVYNAASITTTTNPFIFDLILSRTRGDCVPQTVNGSVELISLCPDGQGNSFAWQARFVASINFLKPFKCPPTVLVNSENAIPTLAVPLGYAFLAQRDGFNVTAASFSFAISIIFTSCPGFPAIALAEMTALVLAFRRDDVNLDILAVGE